MVSRRSCVLILAAGIAVIMLAATGVGQTLSRVATTVDAVTRYATFFHDKAIAVVGTPVPVAGGAHVGLAVEAPRTFAFAPRSGVPPEKRQEFRGRLVDVGRFLSDDSRLGPLNLLPIIASVSGEQWPGRERLFVLTNASWTDPPAANDVSVRAIALSPTTFDGRVVTVRGRFRGRNLLGDLPTWPRESQWDFVIQAADGAIWILGRRPRGSGFDLSTTSRAQTGRWLEVTGRVEIRDALPVILASEIRTTAAESDAIDIETPPSAPLPPPEVIFSAPASGELAVARDVVVRFQFSRPMDESSFAGRIRVRYAQEPDRPVPAFTITYRPAPMAVEVRFEGPLAPSADVAVELLDGIRSADGIPLAASGLRFSTSGF